MENTQENVQTQGLEKAAPRTMLSIATAMCDFLNDKLAAVGGDIAVVGIYPLKERFAATPYICVARESLNCYRLNGKPEAETAFVDVEIVSAFYEQGLDIAETVRAILEGHKGDIGGLAVDSVKFAGAREGMNEDSGQYVQRLNFAVDIEKGLHDEPVKDTDMAEE